MWGDEWKGRYTAIYNRLVVEEEEDEEGRVLYLEGKERQASVVRRGSYSVN